MEDIYELNGIQYNYSQLQEKYGDRTDEAIEHFGFEKIEQNSEPEESQEPQEIEKEYEYDGQVFSENQLKEKYGDKYTEAIEHFGFSEVKKNEEEGESELSSEPSAEESAEINPTTEEPELVKLNDKEQFDFSSHLWDNIIPAGVNDVNKYWSSLGESFYSIASIPQNFVADNPINFPLMLLGADPMFLPENIREDLRTNPDKFKKLTGIQNKIYDHYIEEGEKIQKRIDEYNEENYDNASIEESINNGDWKEAAQHLVTGILRSAPTSLAMMAGGAAVGSTAKLAAATTVVFTEESRRELVEENPEMSNTEAGVKAVMLAGAEAVFESIGTARIGVLYKKILAKEGAENGTRVFKDVIVNSIDKALQKYGTKAGAAIEGLTEVATQITQNLIKGRPAFEGALDAFAIGMGSGATMTAPKNLITATRAVKQKVGERKLNKELNKNGVENISDLFNDDAITDVQLEISGKKYSRGLLEKDLNAQVKEGLITQDEKDNKMMVFDETAALFNGVNDTPLTSEEKVQAANLLKERVALESEIEGVEKSLVQDKVNRIEEINKELDVIGEKYVTKKDAKTEEDTKEKQESKVEDTSSETKTEPKKEEVVEDTEEFDVDVFDAEETGIETTKDVQEKEVFMKTEQAEKLNIETRESVEDIMDEWSKKNKALEESQKNGEIERDEKLKLQLQLKENRKIAVKEFWEASKTEVISPENSSNYANMTEDEEGNFVFFHRGKKGYEKVKKSTGGTKVTSREESAALSKVGGLAMYYTNPNDSERQSANESQYAVKVPKEKVYDFNTDPLNLIEQAKVLHHQEHPNKAFDFNSQVAYVAKVADGLGFDMIVSEWNGTTRGQTIKELTPSDVSNNDGSKKFKNKYKGNQDRGYLSVVPKSKKESLQEVYDDIHEERNKSKKYDKLYHLRSESENYSQEEITKLVANSDISAPLKQRYLSVVEAKEESRKSLKKVGQHNEEFFTGKAEKPSSDIPYKPVLKVDETTPVAEAYKIFSANGNFTGHISKMIAGFQEKQKQVAEAIVKMKFNSFLDLGASEGGLAKTVGTLLDKARVVALDPNSRMKANFESTPKVDNVEFVQEAYQGSWTEADGTKINEFKPTQKFDVVNEDFAFQFMNKDRDAQVKGVKAMMNPNGIFITSEKFINTANYDANEKKKYDHQSKYFNESELTKDKEEIVVGMSDDMVNDVDYYNTLKENFNHVQEFWNAGNFKGYIASDNIEVLNEFRKNVGDLTSEFTDEGSLTSDANLKPETKKKSKVEDNPYNLKEGQSKIADKPDLESPVWVTRIDGKEFFLQKVYGNDVHEWVTVKKDKKGNWFEDDPAVFDRGSMRRKRRGYLGETKKEAIETLTKVHNNRKEAVQANETAPAFQMAKSSVPTLSETEAKTVEDIFDEVESEVPVAIDNKIDDNVKRNKIDVPKDSRPESKLMSALKLPLNFILGKKVGLGMSDTLTIGERTVEVADDNGNISQKTIREEGGIGYPFKSLMDFLSGKSDTFLGWAAVGKGAATKMVNAAKKADKITGKELKQRYIESLNLNESEKQRLESIPDDKEFGIVAIYKMGKDGLTSNEAFSSEAFRQIETKLSEADKKKFFELIEERFKGVIWKQKDKYLDKVVKAKNFNELQRILHGETLPLEVKSSIMTDVILSSNKTTSKQDNPLAAMLKNDYQITEESVTEILTEPIMKGINKGQFAIAVAIDPEANTVYGRERHKNYPYGVVGLPIGLLEETVPMQNMSKEFMDMFVKTSTYSVDNNATYKGDKVRISIAHDSNGDYIAEVGAGTKKYIISDKRGNNITSKTKADLVKKIGRQGYKLSKEAKNQGYKHNVSGTNANNVLQKALASTVDTFKNLKTTSQEKIVNLLQTAFPNIVIETNLNNFREVQDGLRAKQLLNKNGQAYGFIKDGRVYLDPTYLNNNTPIHEFGHVWNAFAKEYRPDLYAKGLELINGEGGKVYLQSVLDSNEYVKVIRELYGKNAIKKVDGKNQINEAHENYNEIKEYVSDEALAKAIGDKGEAFVNEAQKRGFKDWMNRLFAAIKKITGISKVSDEKLQDMSLNDFTNAVLSDLLGGKKISDFSTQELAKSSTEGQYKFSLNEEADLNTKTLLKKVSAAYTNLRNRKAKAEQIRKDLRKQIKDFIKKDEISQMGIQDIQSILKSVDNAKTAKSLEAALKNFDKIAAKAKRRGIKSKYAAQLKKLKAADLNALKTEIANEVKALGNDFFGSKVTNKNIKQFRKAELERIYKKLANAKTSKQVQELAKQLEDTFYELESRVKMTDINKILKRKLTIKQSGRRKGNLTDEQSTKVIVGVKQLLKEYAAGRKGIARSERMGYDIDYISSLLETQKELVGKITSLTDSELGQLTSINIAVGILNSKTITDSQAKLESLTEAYNELNAVYETGRSKHKAWVDAKRQERNDFILRAEAAVNPNDVSISQSKDTVINNRSGIITAITRTVFNWTSGKWGGDFDSALQTLDRAGSKNINDSWANDVSEQVREASTKKTYNLREYAKKIKKAQRTIFGSAIGRGSDFAMNKILNKQHTFTVSVPTLNKETNTVDWDNMEEQTKVLTESQLLNLWMHYKNEELHHGFEAAGYDAAFMEKVDGLLNKKTKEYGEFLFDFYDSYYDHINKTYKEMYGHSLGKPKFYAGKLAREGFVGIEEDLMNGLSVARTTAGGSTKERVNTNLPIVATDVNQALSAYLFESEHFTQYAPIHSKLQAMVGDRRFNNAVMANNKHLGDALIKQIEYYIKLEIVRGGKQVEALRALDVLMSNLVKSTLAIKPKIALTQTLSMTNAVKYLPRGKNGFKGYNPATFFADAKHIFKNSKYIQNRLDSNTLNKALSGLDSVSNQEVFGNKVGNGAKQFLRAYDALQNVLMVNVKVGDMIGVMGSFPVYTGWKAEYLSRGMSEAKAEQKAMRKFEHAVDSAQQGQTKFSKSQLQNNPIGKMFSMYATSPLQNYRNAIGSYREVSRYFRKGQHMKGSLARHILSIANFTLLQPLLYTWVAGRLKGGLMWLLRGDDEEPTEAEKAMLSQLILRNSTALAFVGSAMLLVVDEILEKEHTFGGVMNNPIMDEANKIKKYYDRAEKAKKESSKMDNYGMMKKSFYKLLTGLPINTAEHYRHLFANLEEYQDEYDMTELMWISLGHSSYSVLKDRDQKKKQTTVLK